MELSIRIITLLLFCLESSKSFTLENNEAKLINRTSDEFLRVQVHAIASYKKKKSQKKWKCSYEDHLKALSYVPLATSSQQTFFADLVQESLNNTGMKLIRGAKSVAQLEGKDIYVLLIWDGMLINSLEYFNVLYGGNKYFHIGIGLPFPESFYGNQNEELRFYDLKSCTPFTDWIDETMSHRIKEMLIMPKESNLEIRNAVSGIAALLAENENSEGIFNLFPSPQMDTNKKSNMTSKSNESLDAD